jgi:hypothetical protein
MHVPSGDLCHSLPSVKPCRVEISTREVRGKNLALYHCALLKMLDSLGPGLGLPCSPPSFNASRFWVSETEH